MGFISLEDPKNQSVEVLSSEDQHRLLGFAQVLVGFPLKSPLKAFILYAGKLASDLLTHHQMTIDNRLN